MNCCTFYTKFLFIACLFFNFSAGAQSDCNCQLYQDLLSAGKPKQEIYNQVVKQNTSFCQAKAAELIAEIFLLKIDQLDSAELYLKNAETLYNKMACGDGALMNTYKNWFQLYWSKSDYPKAQNYALKYLHSAELEKNPYHQAVANTMIAITFYRTNQFEQGLGFVDKAAALLPNIKENKQKILYLIAVRYMTHYLNTDNKSSIENSLKYNLAHLDLSKNLKDTIEFSRSYFNLSGTAEATKNWKLAISYLDSGYLFIDKTDSIDLYDYHANKASLYLELKNYKQANIFADSALYYVQKTAHQTDIAVCYNLLASIAKEKGDFKNALKYYQLSNAINDSINNVVKTKAVVELEKKYNQAKNENLIKDLGKKQQLYLLLAIAGLFAAIAIGFFLRQQSLKHKKDILETEQRLNRARINPHFFFNTLTTLQKIALSETDKHNLASQLSKFSNIMRETLESTYKDYITIEEEIEFLQQYFDLQKIRFPNSFNVDFIIPQDLEIDEVLLPAMILQPFVENSIEHGFAGIDYPGNITIKFIADHANLLVEIMDNGNGLNTNIKGDDDHISRASQIIKDRLYLLNLKLKTNAGFNINNVESGGVLVKINLPLLYKESI